MVVTTDAKPFYPAGKDALVQVTVTAVPDIPVSPPVTLTPSTPATIKWWGISSGSGSIAFDTPFTITIPATNMTVSSAVNDKSLVIEIVNAPDDASQTSACKETVTNMFTVVKVDIVKYKLNGSWTDIPSAGFTNICLGSQIEFKAFPVPSNVTWPSSSPTWGVDAIGSGEEKSVTFSASGNREITASCGNTVTAKVYVASANTAQTVGWSHGYSCDNNTASATTVERPFSVLYTACADVANDVWYLRVCSVTGGTDIAVHLGSFKTPNPGVNITNAADGATAITDMLLESSTFGPATTWVTEDAIRTHENWHRDEWIEISEHYWPATEAAIEAITVPYHLYVNDVAAAVTAMKAGGSGADAKNVAYKAKSHAYWFTLGDSPGDRPYRAGGVVLNPLIDAIRTYGAAQTPPWSGLPAGTNAGPGADHCYQPWLPYSP